MSKKLEMSFINQKGTTNKISVDDVRSDITNPEVETAMQTIVEKKIFSNKSGDLIEADSARIVETQIKELF